MRIVSLLVLLWIPIAGAGADKRVLINSQPPGAHVKLVGGGIICKAKSTKLVDGLTPCFLSVPKSAFDPDGAPWEDSTLLGVPLTVTLSKEDYRTASLTLTDGPHIWKGKDTNGSINRTYYFVKADKFEVMLESDPVVDCKRYYEKNELQKAVGYCSKAISSMGDTPEPDAFHYRCMANFLLNNLPAALGDCERLTSLRKDSDIGWNNTGLILQSLDRHAEAIDKFSTALSINPKNVKALRNRTISYEKMNRIREALQDCDAVLKIEPQNADFISLRRLLASQLAH